MAFDQSSRRSVAKLYLARKAPSSYQPWEFKYQEHSTASACVVDGRRLLTCAHVVSHALHIQATKPGDARRYQVRIDAVDHDSELALLSVDDEGFFEGTNPVVFGSLPHQQAEISVWGFPGGADLSITTGVISRTEVIAYTHSRRRLLSLQTDAVINPGNSGGPAFLGDRLIGIALQPGRREESRKANLIPVPVIEHFLEDLRDGRVTGVPDLGVQWQKIENVFLRDYLGLSEAQTGIWITDVLVGGSTVDVLRPGDVVTSIDGVPLAGDGTFAFREDHRLPFSLLVSKRQVGELMTLELVRERRSLKVDVVLRGPQTLVRPTYADRVESFFIAAGLVFQRLTLDYMNTWPWDKVDERMKTYYLHGKPTSDRRDVVLLSQVLAHEVNVGYHDVQIAVVATVNGVVIRQLADVVRAWQQPVDGSQVIELESVAGGEDGDGAVCRCIVIDASRARAAQHEILARHGIPEDRSRDLPSD